MLGLADAAASDPACDPEPSDPAWLDPWRERWRVPRLVHLSSGDLRLLLDLNDGAHRAQLAAAMRAAGRRPVLLQEGLPAPAHAWLPGPRGRHVVELVVPLVRASAQPTRTTASPTPPATVYSRDERCRPPGSDWLYLVLEGPRRTENALLTGSLGTLAQQLVDRGHADGWFFVRYADPAPHLRFRIHGRPAAWSTGCSRS